METTEKVQKYEQTENRTRPVKGRARTYIGTYKPAVPYKESEHTFIHALYELELRKSKKVRHSDWTKVPKIRFIQRYVNGYKKKKASENTRRIKKF